MDITTFSVLVENKFWVLARISRLFSRHTFNIKSLTVAPTLDDHISCMTIDVAESKDRIRRMELELRKIINVLSVHICDPDHYMVSELVLVKIQQDNPHYANFLKDMNLVQARVIYSHSGIEIYEYSGDKDKIDYFMGLMTSYKVESVVRTGTLAMPKDETIWSLVNTERKYR